MSFTKKALKAGGIAALGTFTFFSTFIPFIGPIVGGVAGLGVFIVVETGALIGAGGYLAGKGMAHGVKHLCKSGCRKKHHHQSEPHLEDEKSEINTVTTPVSATQPIVDTKVDWTSDQKAPSSPVSITQFGLHQNVNPIVSQVTEQPVLETGLRYT